MDRGKLIVILALFLLAAFISPVGVCFTEAEESAVSDTVSFATWPQTVYFRGDFNVEGDGGRKGVIRITAVNSYELYFNGASIGSDSVWTTAEEYSITTATGSNKSNTIAVKVVNRGQGEGSGLIVEVEVDTLRMVSDIDKVNNPWYWTAEPQSGTSWANSKLTDLAKDASWDYVQIGYMKRGKVVGLKEPSSGVIWGYPYDADVGNYDRGITLKWVRGENLAFGRPVEDRNAADQSRITDGDRTKGWSPGTTAALNHFVDIDLQSMRQVNRVKVITNGTKASDWNINSLRGYTVHVSEDGFRWSEVAALYNIGEDDKSQYKETEVSFKTKTARYVRVVIAQIDGINEPDLGEVEVYGDGYAEAGSYFSEVMDLGSPFLPKNFGGVNWEADVPKYTSLSLQFRTGDTTVPDDSWSDWSEEYFKSPVYFSSPEPKRYLQCRINFQTEKSSATPKFKLLHVESSTEIVCRVAKAEVIPDTTDVLMGQPVDITYSLDLDFSSNGSDLGVKRIVVSVPSSASSVTIDELGPGEYTATSEGDSLKIDFDPSLDSDITLTIHFSTILYGSSHDFRSYLYSSLTETNPQNVEENRTQREYAWSVFVVDVMPKVLSRVKANPDVFSPNGDGICDYTVIEFVLSKIEEARNVDIKIFDLTGTVVRDLEVDRLEAGEYTLRALQRVAPGFWDGTDDGGDLLPPGIYIYQVKVKTDKESKVSNGTVVLAY